MRCRIGYQDRTTASKISFFTFIVSCGHSSFIGVVVYVGLRIRVGWYIEECQLLSTIVAAVAIVQSEVAVGD